MRKEFMFFILLTLMFFYTSYAGMKEYLDNSVIVIERDDTTIETNDYRVNFGGGFAIKTPNVNFQPFIVQSPSFRAGCGGIDIVFGAFSYFNVEYLVNFLKAIASQAPAFAFQTAVQTLCPQCSQIMNNLTSLANSINGLNFSSCEVSQKLGGAVGSWFGNTINNALKIGVSGPDWLKTVNEKIDNIPEVLNDFKQSLLNKGCNPSDRSCYANFLVSSKTSLISYMSQDIPYISSDTNIQSIIRALIGDLLKKDSNGLKVVFISPSVSGRELIRIIKGISKGDGICDEYWTYENAISEDGSTKSVRIKTICNYVDNKLTSIINKVETGGTLTTDELKFLSMFRIPVYKLINVLSLQPGTLRAIKTHLVNYLTYELTYSILSSIFSRYNRMLSKFESASEDKVLPIRKDDLEKIRFTMNNTLRETFKFVVSYQEELRKQIKDNISINRLQAMIIASLARHPIMDSRLYTKYLLGF